MKKLDLNKAGKKAAAIGEGSNSREFISKLITNEDGVEIRVVAPSVGDSFFIEVPIWWVDKKPFISRELLDGEIDCIQDEINKLSAKYAGKKRMKNQIEKLLSGRDCKKASEIWLLGVQLTFDRNEEEEIEGLWIDDLTEDKALDIRKELKKAQKKDPETSIVEILEDEPYEIEVGKTRIGKTEPILLDVVEECMIGKVKILVANRTTIQGIIAEFQSKAVKKYTSKVDLGALDQYAGFNLTIYKSGSDKKTTYTVKAATQPMEMPDSLYLNLPNMLKVAEGMIQSEEDQRAAVRAFLTGESEDSDDEDEDEDEEEDKRVSKTTKSKRRKDEEDEGDDEPTPAERRAARKKKEEARKKIVEDSDDEDEDEEEEDEAPKTARQLRMETKKAKPTETVKPKATKKVVEEEEEEDEDSDDETGDMLSDQEELDNLG